MPQKTHTGRPVLFLAVAESSAEEGIVANSPVTMKESPGLPAGRAESFPVQGELCLHATSVAPFVEFGPTGRFQLVALAISMALPKDAGAIHPILNSFAGTMAVRLPLSFM